MYQVFGAVRIEKVQDNERRLIFCVGIFRLIYLMLY